MEREAGVSPDSVCGQKRERLSTEVVHRMTRDKWEFSREGAQAWKMWVTSAKLTTKIGMVDLERLQSGKCLTGGEDMTCIISC